MPPYCEDLTGKPGCTLQEHLTESRRRQARLLISPTPRPNAGLLRGGRARGAATGKLRALGRATGEVPVTVRRPRKGGTPNAHAVPSSRCIFVTKLTIMYRF